MEQENLSIKEAARWFNCTPPTLYRLISSGDLKTFKVGRRRFISRQALYDCRANLEEQASV
jgi:excisionase family DNA binding protein